MPRSFRWPLAAAALLVAAPAPAEVYRCSVDGVQQFSDRPCGGARNPTELAPISVVPAAPAPALATEHDRRTRDYRKARDAEDAKWTAAHERGQADAERLRAARIAGRVVAGMSAADVRRLLGEPQRISRSDKGETWSYNDAERGRTTVTLQDGVVSKVSTSGKKKP